jgi:hypothetical protein
MEGFAPLEEAEEGNQALRSLTPGSLDDGQNKVVGNQRCTLQ